MAGRALWFIPTARERMPAVWDWINKTDYVDKLILRNFQKDTADEIAMQFFFARDEYDYFIISTDDILGTEYQVKTLLDDEEKHGFPIISGWCNHFGLAASLRVEPLDSDFLMETLKKPFPGLTFKEYDFALNRDVLAGDFGYPFFEVWYTGIPLTLIQKETLREAPFREFRRCNDRFCITPEARREGRGVMQDLQWAIDCAEKNIPITIDTRVFLFHVFNTRSRIRVGYKPHVKLIPARGREFADKAEIDALLEEITISAWKQRKLTKKHFID